ncbi:hypothetical protein F5Y03DRAFT_405452 [Xylaria venustula]|nr:hypothetical protein F5Y03DRAFT_405452 [Xylaria venustula]
METRCNGVSSGPADKWPTNEMTNEMTDEMTDEKGKAVLAADDEEPQPRSVSPELPDKGKGEAVLPVDDEDIDSIDIGSACDSGASSPFMSLLDGTKPKPLTWPPPSAEEPSSGWAKLFRYDPYLSFLHQALSNAGIKIPDPETVLQTCSWRDVDFIRLVYLPCTSPKPGYQEYKGVPRERWMVPIRVKTETDPEPMEKVPTRDPPPIPGRSSSRLVPEIDTRAEQHTPDGQTLKNESIAVNEDEYVKFNEDRRTTANKDQRATGNGAQDSPDNRNDTTVISTDTRASRSMDAEDGSIGDGVVYGPFTVGGYMSGTTRRDR